MKCSVQRIAVVGMGRSGTSYLTEWLERCGVFVGHVNWAHEHPLARLINDTILEHDYGARPGLPYGELPPAEITVPEEWHANAGCFIRSMDSLAREAGARTWAFKDPRTTLLHTLWIPSHGRGCSSAPDLVVLNCGKCCCLHGSCQLLWRGLLMWPCSVQLVRVCS